MNLIVINSIGLRKQSIFYRTNKRGYGQSALINALKEKTTIVYNNVTIVRVKDNCYVNGVLCSVKDCKRMMLNIFPAHVENV